MTNSPKISILTPTTCSRLRFIESMMQNIDRQTYPKHLVEWVVVGDLEEKTRRVFERVFDTLSVSCRYIECPIQDNIGKKRNYACSVASAKVFANMDDDDLYHRLYLENSIRALQDLRVNLVGCRDMLVFSPIDGGSMIYVRGKLIHEATIVCTKNHWRQFRYVEKMDSIGEGRSLAQGSYFNRMDISKTMVCVSHDTNTFDKTPLFRNACKIALSDQYRDLLLSMCRKKNLESVHG